MEQKPVVMVYRNWRGETSLREITPDSIYFGETVYHQGPQWILRAFDHNKNEPREFALKDCIFTHIEPVS